MKTHMRNHFRAALQLAMAAGALFGLAGVSAAQEGAVAASETFSGDVGPHHRVHTLSVPGVSSSQAASAAPRRQGPPGAERRIVEIGTGMNYWDSSLRQWAPSDPSFTVVSNTFVAERVQHRLQIQGDLNVRAAVALRLDQMVLQSTPVAIALYDEVSGRFQVIAGITNCAGVQVSTNQVVFPDAFGGGAGGCCATIVYTVEGGAFSQDVVFTGRLDPADWLFPRESSQIQIWTELYDSPQPDRERFPVRVEQDPLVRQRKASPDLMDETLSFGQLVIGQGYAYATPSQVETNGARAVVTKEFKNIDGRTFLAESIEYSAIARGLQSLPECARPANGEGTRRQTTFPSGYAGIPRAAPATQAKASPAAGARRLAQAAGLKPSGVTIDYRATLCPTTTLQAGTTYLVASPVTCSTLTLEGPVVLKHKVDTSVSVTGSLICKTPMGRPAIFTSVDDDSVGESMRDYTNSGWTGTNDPSGYANPALNLAQSATLSGCVFRYAKVAVANSVGTSTFGITANHSQFVNCIKAISIGSAPSGTSGLGTPSTGAVVVNNVLMANVQYPVTIPVSLFYNFSAANCTFDQCVQVLTVTGSGTAPTFTSYNSIYANVTYAPGGAFAGNNNGFYQAQTLGNAPAYTASVWPFQSAGAGNYYLSESSGWRGAGATNISASLLADLRKRTTYPPLLYSNLTLSADTALGPQAQRNTGPLDLGYHYCPIDYITVSVRCENATLSITNGATIAYYHTNYGIWLADNAQIVAEGTPLRHNCFAPYAAIQEQPLSLGQTPPASSFPILASRPGGLAGPATFRFTDFLCLPGDVQQLSQNDGSGEWDPLSVRDCTFAGGAVYLGGASPRTALVQNNLFERCNLTCEDSPVITLRNNLFRYCTNVLDNWSATAWVIKDNAFDNSAVTASSSVPFDCGCNAYINTTRPGALTGTNDQVLSSLAYATGPLGNYYQPANSSLVNTGSVSDAALVGLYHYTTTTNQVNGLQVKELHSRLDIGLHLVAVDQEGNPVDSDGDLMPDYLEDYDGNGTVGSGERNWLSSENGTTGVPGLQVFTPLK